MSLRLAFSIISFHLIRSPASCSPFLTSKAQQTDTTWPGHFILSFSLLSLSNLQTFSAKCPHSLQFHGPHYVHACIPPILLSTTWSFIIYMILVLLDLIPSRNFPIPTYIRVGLVTCFINYHFSFPGHIFGYLLFPHSHFCINLYIDHDLL